MNTTSDARVRTTPRERAREEFLKLLAAAETRGFYGTATITVAVQDGHVQHVKVGIERTIRE